RRQSAEGDRRPLAAYRRPRSHRGGSDRGRRRRRQGGNLPPARPGARHRPQRRRRVDRFRGSGANLPQGARVLARPDRRRAQRRRAFRRAADSRGVRRRLKRGVGGHDGFLGQIDGARTHPKRTGGAQRSRPDQAFRAHLRARHPDRRARAPVQHPPARHVPDPVNVRSIISDKAIIAILSLGVMIPMVAGKIDLTVGYGIVLWHILAISLQTRFNFPWPLAVMSVLALGAGVGLINGVLVEIAKIDAFIATLGTGTILYAIAMWYSKGRQIVGVAPDAFYALNGADLFGLPITGYYVLALSVALWLILEYLPIGRYFYAIGANPKAAALNGVPVRRYTILTFVASGLLTAFAGVILAAKLRIGQASVGLEYLLPALVGAFLGSTTIKPGRVNVWGTVVGVTILAIGISGIQQFGAMFFVEPLFNGATLLVAIGIAGYAQRRRGAEPARAPATTAQSGGALGETAATSSKGGKI